MEALLCFYMRQLKSNHTSVSQFFLLPWAEFCSIPEGLESALPEAHGSQIKPANNTQSSATDRLATAFLQVHMPHEICQTPRALQTL